MLGKRLAKFGLELHPDKTQLIDFRPPAERADVETTLPTTFVFLGFLHVWGQSRKGNATMWQRTATDRLARTLKRINEQCRLMRPRRLWRKWLSRCSWKSYVTWEKFLRLVDRYPLPVPRIIYRYT